MFIYNGKFNWLPYAENETITVVAPAGFALKDPISAYWQWSVDAQGNKKENVCLHGTIHEILCKTDEFRVAFSFGYYSFEAVVASDFSTFTAILQNPKGDRSDPITMARMFADASRVPAAAVFTGKLQWQRYAVDEMATLVIPSGSISEGAQVGLYHQWTADAAGNVKANHPINFPFRNVATSAEGDVSGTIDGSYYTYVITMDKDEREVEIKMSNTYNYVSTFKLTRNDFRDLGTKKALVVRYGTGTDNGIFSVRKMLTGHLGFAERDIQMCYFDDEADECHPVCTKGQMPPTLSQFQDLFATLLSSAAAGDVRFVYIDAHRSIPVYADGENDMRSFGWNLAQGGSLTDEWIGNTIRENLKPGVNLTILTSWSASTNVFDQHTTTPGFFLTGCYENQLSIKAMKTDDGLIDPWTQAIISVVEKHAQSKRNVPSYTVLFHEAKKYVQKQLNRIPPLHPNYKGPSPNEDDPLPLDSTWSTSHQDPQLMFCDGYADPDVERFLFPFTEVYAGKASGGLVVYPRDEI